jgi:serine/threonine-protein kinase HipA
MPFFASASAIIPQLTNPPTSDTLPLGCRSPENQFSLACEAQSTLQVKKAISYQLFWLIGATDGHAKNFSIFLGRGGRFKLTPVYDVLTAQPSLGSRQIERKQLKLAMSVGDSRHYRIDEIKGRHFIQSAERAGLPGSLASEVLTEVSEAAETAINTVVKQLPRGFPKEIYLSVKAGLTARLQNI